MGALLWKIAQSWGHKEHPALCCLYQFGFISLEFRPQGATAQPTQGGLLGIFQPEIFLMIIS